MLNQEHLWIVVADGARARFYSPRSDLQALVETRAPLTAGGLHAFARELKSDRPGRVASADSSARHAIEPRHDPRKLETHKFTAHVAEVLDQACADQGVRQIVLVAPRRSPCELRGL